MERIEGVRKFRLSSSRASTVKLADSPTRFQTENMPASDYIVIPEVSSERRRYIPLGFMTPNKFCSNKLRLMPNATLYHFGVLNSSAHMGWMRTVSGRLKSDYSYSVDIAYNAFVWPQPTEAQRSKIEKTAQRFLMPAHSILTQAWRTCMTKLRCPRSSGEPIRQTIRRF